MFQITLFDGKPSRDFFLLYLSSNNIFKLNKKFLFEDGFVTASNSMYKLKLFGIRRSDLGMNSRLSSIQLSIWKTSFWNGHFSFIFVAFSNLLNKSFFIKLFLASNVSQRLVVVFTIVMYLPGAIGLLIPYTNFTFIRKYLE